MTFIDAFGLERCTASVASESSKSDTAYKARSVPFPRQTSLLVYLHSIAAGVSHNKRNAAERTCWHHLLGNCGTCNFHTFPFVEGLVIFSLLNKKTFDGAVNGRFEQTFHTFYLVCTANFLL